MIYFSCFLGHCCVHQRPREVRVLPDGEPERQVPLVLPAALLLHPGEQERQPQQPRHPHHQGGVRGTLGHVTIPS